MSAVMSSGGDGHPPPGVGGPVRVARPCELALDLRGRLLIGLFSSAPRAGPAGLTEMDELAPLALAERT